MNITLDDFKKHATTAALHKAGLHAISRVHLIMTKFYCSKMTSRSLCPADCSRCSLMLQETIKTIDPAQITNSYAIFTYRLKAQFARQAEAASTAHCFIPNKSILGEMVEVDPMDTLLDQYA